MKKLFYILVLLTFLGCKKETLKVIIESEYSEEAYLYNTETQKTDTIKASGNRFVAHLPDIKKPTLYYLMFKEINDVNRPIYLILSDEETEIKFNKLTAVDEKSQNVRDFYPNKPLFLSDPNKNEVFYQFQDLWMTFFNKVTNPELDYEARKGLYDNFISNSENILKANRNKVVSAYIIDYLMKYNLIQLDKIQLFYSYLEPNIQTSSVGQRIKKEVGFENQTSAPRFSLQDFHGNNYSLDSLNGKKVLLHFWSSACAPCIKEIPELIRLASEKKDLVIINISLDLDQRRWIAGMERLGITNLINFCDFKGANGKICKDYHIKSIPANYLIDENGNILLKNKTIQGLSNEL